MEYVHTIQFKQQFSATVLQHRPNISNTIVNAVTPLQVRYCFFLMINELSNTRITKRQNMTDYSDLH